jgi:hypothetical protein
MEVDIICGTTGVSQTYYKGQEPDEASANAIKGLTQIITFDLLPQQRYNTFYETRHFCSYVIYSIIPRKSPQRYQIPTS